MASTQRIPAHRHTVAKRPLPREFGVAASCSARRRVVSVWKQFVSVDSRSKRRRYRDYEINSSPWPVWIIAGVPINSHRKCSRDLSASARRDAGPRSADWIFNRCSGSSSHRWVSTKRFAFFPCRKSNLRFLTISREPRVTRKINIHVRVSR